MSDQCLSDRRRRNILPPSSESSANGSRPRLMVSRAAEGRSSRLYSERVTNTAYSPARTSRRRSQCPVWMSGCPTGFGRSRRTSARDSTKLPAKMGLYASTSQISRTRRSMFSVSAGRLQGVWSKRSHERCGREGFPVKTTSSHWPCGPQCKNAKRPTGRATPRARTRGWHRQQRLPAARRSSGAMAVSSGPLSQKKTAHNLGASTTRYKQPVAVSALARGLDDRLDRIGIVSANGGRCRCVPVAAVSRDRNESNNKQSTKVSGKLKRAQFDVGSALSKSPPCLAAGIKQSWRRDQDVCVTRDLQGLVVPRDTDHGG